MRKRNFSCWRYGAVKTQNPNCVFCDWWNMWSLFFHVPLKNKQNIKTHVRGLCSPQASKHQSNTQASKHHSNTQAATAAETVVQEAKHKRVKRQMHHRSKGSTKFSHRKKRYVAPAQVSPHTQSQAVLKHLFRRGLRTAAVPTLHTRCLPWGYNNESAHNESAHNVTTNYTEANISSCQAKILYYCVQHTYNTQGVHAYTCPYMHLSAFFCESSRIRLPRRRTS